MTHTTYPQVEQFETRDRELRAERLLRQRRAAHLPAGRATRQRLVALMFAGVGGR